MIIKTPRLDLIAAEIRHFEAMEDTAMFERELGCTVCDGWDQFPGAMKQAYESLLIVPELMGWWTYFFIHRTEQTLIGTGGFHGRPDVQGTVEIGYCIAPEYQNAGYATEVARNLIDYAFTDPSVRTVIAHTTPNESASTGVLKKAGLRFESIKVDPVEGSVWLWSIERDHANK